MDLDFLKDYNLTFKSKDDEIVTYKFNNHILNGMFHGYGLPVGKVVQFCAESGTGKTTILLQMAKELCDQGKNIIYIDTENGLNLPLLKNVGLDQYINEKFISIKENDCTKINNLLNEIATSKDVDCVFIDSLAALDSGIYKLGGTDANTPKVGGNTQSIKIIMNTINSCTIRNDKLTFILINHVANVIGSFIPQTKTTGGNSPVYMSDFVIQLYKRSAWKIGDTTVGQKVSFEAIKSRWGMGKCKLEFYVQYGYGINLLPTYRDLLMELDTVYNETTVKHLSQKGGFYTLILNNQEYKARGDKAVLSLIGEHFSEIKSIFDRHPELFQVVVPEEIDSVLKLGTASKGSTLGNINVTKIPQEEWPVPELREIKVTKYINDLPVIYGNEKSTYILYNPIENAMYICYSASEPDKYDTVNSVSYSIYQEITTNLDKMKAKATKKK